MNKGIIIGIIVVIIIGGALAAFISNTETEEVLPIEDISDEPKQFTVGLEESVGFTENP